jgi:eukaryotic-like serine/threonine-protein kinase
VTDLVDSSEKPVTSVRPGDILAGKYRVERVLGVGGMGVVVAAHHIALDERVALKFLHPSALGNAAAIARFIREARAAAKIKNEHVARVIDVGALEDGSPYMVMEYLEGRDLGAWLEHRGPMPVERAVDFVIQATEAIAEAHALDIVHRDLKPANLFCIQRSDGQLSIKVLDFGISKVTKPGAPGHGMTKTSELMGTPYYMSPEQMQQSREVDARADIWSLGVILFELITGRPPFLSESVMDLAIKVATEPPPSMRALRPEVPALLEAIVFKCLEKDRRRRYENVSELVLALLPFASESSRASVDRIAGILRTSGLTNAAMLPMGDIPVLASRPEGPGGTIAPLGQTASGTASVSARRGALIGLAVVSALIAGVAFIRRGPRESAESSWASSPPLESVASTVPVSTSPEAAAAATEGDMPGAPPASSQAPRPAPRVTGGQPARRPSAGPSPDCDPPFTLDDQGRKHFKHECYSKP